MAVVYGSSKYKKEFSDRKLENVLNKVIRHAAIKLTHNNNINLELLAEEKSCEFGVSLQTMKEKVELPMIKNKEKKDNSSKTEIVFKGHILNNNKNDAEYCGLKENSVIKIVNLQMKQINIETLDGRTLLIEVNKKDSIDNLIKKIEDRLLFDREVHILEYKGKPLSYKYGSVEDGSVVKIVKKMLLYIEVFSGRTYTIEIMKNDRVLDIKKKIQEKIGVTPEEQILMYNDQILKDDNKAVGKYIIAEDSKIYILDRLRGMQISVKTLDGKTVTLEVGHTITIIDIKKKIQEKLGKAPDEQKLIYNGRQLEDDKTADEYGIGPHSSILVVFRARGGMQISVRTLDGKMVALEVGPNTTIIELKKKIQEKIGMRPDYQKLVYQGGILDDDDKTADEYYIVPHSSILVVFRPRGGSQIYVKTLDGKMVALEVDTNNTTIIELKNKIEEKLGVAPEVQKLIFSGRILEDERTCRECGIIVNSVINLSHRIRGGMQIFVKTLDGKYVVLEVEYNTTIIDIKKKIQEKIGLLAEEQRLIFKGIQLEYNNKTLYEYNIAGGSTVEVTDREHIKIYVEYTKGETFSMKFKKSDKLENIKKDILEKIGLSPSRLMWRCKETLLEDDNKTLDEYNIGYGSVINVVEILSVIIKKRKGERFMLEIDVEDSIQDLKMKIQRITEVRPEDQSLKINGQIIHDNNKKVFYCGIVKDNDEVELTVISKMTIFIITDNMETIPLEILNIDTISDIKEKIKDKVGIPSEEQILVHQDEEVGGDTGLLELTDRMNEFEFQVILRQ